MLRSKQILRFLKGKSLFIAIGISALFAIAGSIVSILRFWQYEVFYYDFGIFDKVIWSVSQFSTPVIDHIAVGEKIIFADHFSPSLFLLSPLFWLFPQNETLLVVQALMVAASGFVLFLIGKHVLKNAFYTTSIMLMYFLFVGLQNAVITDFHEVTIATFSLMITFYFMITKKPKHYFLSLIILLGFKESLFLLGIGIAIAIFFLQPTWRKISLFTFLISLLWGIVSTKIIIPFFSGGIYQYASGFPTDPLAITSSLINSPVKQHTLFYSFFSFGFLPLLTPAFWPLILQDFVTRFYPQEWQTRWGLGLHYSALLAAIMSLSSVYSLKFLQKRLKHQLLTIIVIAVVLNALFLYRITLRGPFALAYNPAFYAHTEDFAFLNEALKQIPKDASIMTQNNLAPHFTHQKIWMLMSDMKRYGVEYYTLKKPDYILIDNHPGQSPNNHFGIKNINALITNLRKDKKYKLIYDKGEIFIFKNSL